MLMKLCFLVLCILRLLCWFSIFLYLLLLVASLSVCFDDEGYVASDDVGSVYFFISFFSLLRCLLSMLYDFESVNPMMNPRF